MVNFKNKDLIRPEKRLYFIVIYMLFYNGKHRKFCRDMMLSVEMFNCWMEENEQAAIEVIEAIKRNILKEAGQKVIGKGEGEHIPTPEEIKNDILIKLSDSVKTERDPQKLANALKVLDAYGKQEDEKKKTKEKSIYDELKGKI